MRKDCPVCNIAEVLEERTGTLSIWGIEVESIYSYCIKCRSCITTEEQSKQNVENCRAAGCYESDMYKKYWEGYSSG